MLCHLSFIGSDVNVVIVDDDDDDKNCRRRHFSKSKSMRNIVQRTYTITVSYRFQYAKIRYFPFNNVIVVVFMAHTKSHVKSEKTTFCCKSNDKRRHTHLLHSRQATTMTTVTAPNKIEKKSGKMSTTKQSHWQWILFGQKNAHARRCKTELRKAKCDTLKQQCGDGTPMESP